MNCYLVIHHTRRISRGIWHGIRAKAVVTIVCIGGPLVIIPAPATPVGVPDVDMPPVMLPWPGEGVWGPEASPAVGWVPETRVRQTTLREAPDVFIAQPSDIYQSSVTPSIPVHSDVPEPSTIAVLGIGLIMLRRIKRDQTN